MTSKTGKKSDTSETRKGKMIGLHRKDDAVEMFNKLDK